MAWASKMERLAINERIASARERLAAEGRPWGRPPRLADDRLELAREMRAVGRSIREIAVALKVARSSVARALSRKDTRAEIVAASTPEAVRATNQGRSRKGTSGTRKGTP